MLKNLTKNWKTTVGGLLGALVFILGQQGVEVAQVNDWGMIAGPIIAALGLSQARDGDKSSEDQK